MIGQIEARRPACRTGDSCMRAKRRERADSKLTVLLDFRAWMISRNSFSRAIASRGEKRE